MQSVCSAFGPAIEKPPMPCVACGGNCGQCGGPCETVLLMEPDGLTRYRMIWTGVRWVRHGDLVEPATHGTPRQAWIEDWQGGRWIDVRADDPIPDKRWFPGRRWP